MKLIGKQNQLTDQRQQVTVELPTVGNNCETSTILYKACII